MAPGLRKPDFFQEEDFRVTIWRKYTPEAEESNTVSNIAGNIASNIAELTVKQRKVLKYCTKPRSAQEILDYLKLTKQTKNFKRHITDLVTIRLLRPIVIWRATSPNQKYITANDITIAE